MTMYDIFWQTKVFLINFYYLTVLIKNVHANPLNSENMVTDIHVLNTRNEQSKQCFLLKKQMQTFFNTMQYFANQIRSHFFASTLPSPFGDYKNLSSYFILLKSLTKLRASSLFTLVRIFWAYKYILII